MQVLACFLLLWTSSTAFITYPRFFPSKLLWNNHHHLLKAGENEKIDVGSIESMKNQIKTTSEQILALKTNYETIVQQTKKFDEDFGERIHQIHADFERLKLRDDHKEIIIRARTEALKDLWATVDSFFRITKLYSNPSSELEKEIAQRYLSLFQKLDAFIQNLGVTRKETIGMQFDAERMEAICALSSNVFPQGAVCEEYHPAYELEGRCIRPAMVAISDGPGPGLE